MEGARDKLLNQWLLERKKRVGDVSTKLSGKGCAGTGRTEVGGKWN